ncbi:hypothetical protein BDZ89DRAFT_1035554 [Hymenopellis radicata]|nr:hypothetical protein BDZ89DRAFT_1035554 [Hymenopellis radicata]
MQSVQYWDSLARNPMWCPEFWERFGREASYRGCGVRSHGLGGLVRIPAMSWGTGFKNPILLPSPETSVKQLVNFPEEMQIKLPTFKQDKLAQYLTLEEAHIEEAAALASKVQDRQDLQLVKDWLSGKLYSGKGRAAPKLQYERGTDTFSYAVKDRSFRCQHDISPCSNDLVSTACAALAFLNTYYSPLLQGVILALPKEGYLLTLSQFQARLEKRACRPMESDILRHLEKIGITLDTPRELFFRVHSRLTLPSIPIGLSLWPKKHVRCEKCSEWIASSNRSTVKGHPCASSNAQSTEYQVVHLWAKLTKEEGISDPYTQELAAFCFGDAMDSLEEDAFGHVLELAKLPSKFSFFWKPTPYDFNIERLVHAVGRSVRLILQHKELTLMEGHISERRQDGSGKVRLQTVRKDTLTTYANVLTKCFGIFLRISALRAQCRQSPSHAAAMKGIDNLYPKLPGKTHIHFRQLLEIASRWDRSIPSCDWPSLVTTVHAILAEIFTTRLPLTGSLHTFIEQSLTIASRTPDRGWRRCCSLAFQCTAIFAVCRAVLRLSVSLNNNPGYLRNLALAAANTEAYLINDAASEEEDDDGEVGDGKDGDGKDANEDMEMNSNAAIATEQQKYLSELDASDYLFGRVKAIARAIVPACKEERCQAPPRRYYWPDDEHLEVNFGDFTSDALTSIHVPELFSYGHRVVYDTAQCLKQLFAGIPSTLSRSILQLSVDSFCEADGSIRLSCYKEKESLIKAMQKKPPKKIISAGQDFLRSFLKAAVYTVGQPPRDWQIRQFRYTATELPRNVILLESGHCAFVQPRPQYSDNILAPHTGREESIWILPPQLTVALLVYLYIYRPLEIWALKACNRPEPVIKTFQNYIFAKNNLGKAVSQPTVWTTDYINSLMKTETKFGFTLGELRLVMKLVMERYHQSLLKHILQPNIVDKNAQHHWRTGLSHYAIDTMRARTGILYGNIEKHILLAESHHAACSLTLPPRNGEPMEEEEWTDFSGDEAHWDIEKMELQKFLAEK